MSALYLGLMSGTSIDGIDVALVDFSNKKPQLLDYQTVNFASALTHDLHQLCASSENEIELMGRTDRQLAEVSADACLALLKANYLRPDQISAIGSHGQTIRHIPNDKYSFSIQIGDPNSIAALTEIDVIADFRRKDMALGGQGAPLVPAFHQALFSHAEHARAVVNIGGIANITYLPKTGTGQVMGYDTGPGNTLLDAWCKLHTGKNYDDKGQWAAQGKVNAALLTQLLADPYFSAPAPKSTGREHFNLSWLNQQLTEFEQSISPVNVQATLVNLTTQSLCQQIQHFPDVEQVYLCGGGAKNEFLLEELESELHECELFTTDALGVPADAVEAMAFAWLAYAHINRIPGNVPSVTGAKKAAILGTFCPGREKA